MTQAEALKRKLCKKCNFYRAVKGAGETCVATLWPSLNYRDTPVGECPCTEEEIRRLQNER